MKKLGHLQAKFDFRSLLVNRHKQNKQSRRNFLVLKTLNHSGISSPLKNKRIERKQFEDMAYNISTEFGLADKLSHGLHREVDDVSRKHPIEMSERHFKKNQEKAMFEQLRKVQGLHAPLKLKMEKMAVSKVGHFPCISSRSNFQLDILEGNDEMITFDDILGLPEHHEGMNQPHDVIDRSLAQLQIRK